MTGLLQALEHAGNALVWTTFFICGFLPLMTARALGRPLAGRGLAWLTFWLMVGGLVLAAMTSP
ncbi:MAG: hypothetical protein HYR86_05150 [Candidatus Rokubacteria bacterium]|nr:hypothetical protein [Candidatus Rokubacteria bacterium]